MEVMRRRYSAVLVVSVLVSLGLACQSGGGDADVDQRKRIAGELRDNQLYAAAVEEYEAILTSGGLDAGNRGSISYLIARIYFEDLKDYASAAAWYVRSRSYDPAGAYIDDAARNLVTCLEKLGRHVDAKRELDYLTDVENTARVSGTVPVAIVSGDTLWLEDIDRRIQNLPPDLQQQLLPELRC